MDKLKFSKKDTNVVKGLLIIMMLMHHLFYGTETFEGYGVDFTPFMPHQIIVLIQSFKYVMACFTFITYYGMTMKMKSMEAADRKKQLLPTALKRYTTLVMSFLPVYIMAVALTLFMGQNIMDIYTREGHSFPGYILIDALGLSTFFGTPTLNVTWWYLSLAFTIIFLFPFFHALYEKFGFLFVMCAMIFPVALGWNSTDFATCIGTLAFGIFCADKELLSRLKGIGMGKWYIKLLKLICSVLVFALLCKLPYVVPCSNVIFVLGSFFLCYVCFEFLGQIPLVSHMLGFFGKHSMNIFLVHTFFYYYYFKDFIYSFGYWLVIEAVLLGCSLLVSIVIEGLKKLTKYDKLVRWINGKTDHYFGCI